MIVITNYYRAPMDNAPREIGVYFIRFYLFYLIPLFILKNTTKIMATRSLIAMGHLYRCSPRISLKHVTIAAFWSIFLIEFCIVKIILILN